MKYFLLSIALLSASPVAAGGPVLVEDDTDVVAAEPRSDGLVPVIIGLAIACLLFCGGGGDDKPSDGGPKPCVKTGDGC